VRPCNLKPQRRDLTPVLHRPVELAVISGQTISPENSSLSGVWALVERAAAWCGNQAKKASSSA
jgi:hypothetical protein